MNNVINAMLLTKQLAILREVAKDYPSKTIENIIQQMEARRNVSMGHDGGVLSAMGLEPKLVGGTPGERVSV